MNKINIMLGPATNAQGGISSVAAIYKDAGFFQRWQIIYISTYAGGGAVKKLWILLGAFLKFIRAIFLNHVGVVHIHTASGASFWRKSLFVVLSAVFRKPVFLHIHGGGFDVFLNQRCGVLKRKIALWVIHHAACIIVLSKQWIVRLAEISGHPNIVAVANPVVLAPKVGDFLKRAPLDLLFLGRISRMKGAFDVLNALVELRSEFPDIRLLCGGDGDIKEFLFTARSLGVEDRVTFLGWVSGDSKITYLAESSVLVLPSYAEGMPMSILEAMAAGLPIVASMVGAIPETVQDGVEGFLFEAGDIGSFVMALRQLLSDSTLRRKMGEAGRLRVEAEYSVDRVMQCLDQVYSQWCYADTFKQVS